MNYSPSQDQISAGGVVFRQQGETIEIALISVGRLERWQLPKGIINKGESPEAAAQREVREEAGVETDLLGKINTIEYWYYSGEGERRVRFHKQVHFFLMRYLSGSVEDHDYEVNEARWVEIDQAQAMLAFENEKKLVVKARLMIEEQAGG